MHRSAFSALTSGLATTCVAAAVLTPPFTAPPSPQVIPLELTAVTQPLDLLDPAWTSLPVAEVPEAAGLLGIGGLYLSLAGLFNEAVSIITTPLSWVPIVGSLASSVIWMPINLVENALALVLVGTVGYYPDDYFPYAAVDAGELAGPFGLSALPDLTLPDSPVGLDAVPNLDGVGDLAQEAGAAVLNLLP